MRGGKRCQESTGRMKKPRDSHEFKVMAAKMANAPNIETKAVAEVLHIHPFMLSRWKKEVREGTLKGLAHPDLQERKAVEVAVAKEKRLRQLEAVLKAKIRFYNHRRRTPDSERCPARNVERDVRSRGLRRALTSPDLSRRSESQCQIKERCWIHTCHPPRMRVSYQSVRPRESTG